MLTENSATERRATTRLDPKTRVLPAIPRKHDTDRSGRTPRPMLNALPPKQEGHRFWEPAADR
jgi:hypothetical protein